VGVKVNHRHVFSPLSPGPAFPMSLEAAHQMCRRAIHSNFVASMKKQRRIINQFRKHIFRIANNVDRTVL
jgi:hypothetical protein